MSKLLDRFPELGKPAGQDPYIPFLPAVEMGKLKDPEAMAVAPENPLGVDIANGVMPNADAQRMGVVAIGGQIVGVDHVRIRRRNQSLIVAPTDRSAVDSDGRFAAEGAVLMTWRDGRAKLLAGLLDIIQNQWRPTSSRPLGDLAIRMIGLEGTDYEIKAISGTARQLMVPRQRFY